MTIQIEGLNPRQFQLMDLLWNCASIEDVTTLIEALPTERDKADATSLVRIATVDTIEQELGLDEYAAAATAAISCAMR